jgi:hypothetical protein
VDRPKAYEVIIEEFLSIIDFDTKVKEIEEYIKEKEINEVLYQIHSKLSLDLLSELVMYDFS